VKSKSTNRKTVHVIDIFSGPGGLSEGFSRFGEDDWGLKLAPELERRSWVDPHDIEFRIGLSIEKDEVAHKTLTLRAFVRQFAPGQLPKEYYDFLSGKLKLAQLYEVYPAEAKVAAQEAWNFTLAKNEKSRNQVDERIVDALADAGDDWCLLGGPPCQAYSLVGRARNKGIKDYDPEEDERHFLYQEYLRIVAKHRPAIFVMENVKGLLSSKIGEGRIFEKILRDLENPRAATGADGEKLRYRIVSVVTGKQGTLTLQDAAALRKDGKQFILRAEDLGIPQARHRVILLGIRSDIEVDEAALPRLVRREQVGIESVLSGLPKLRSSVSNRKRTTETWFSALKAILDEPWFLRLSVSETEVFEKMRDVLRGLEKNGTGSGNDWLVPTTSDPKYMAEWFVDPKLNGVTNHHARSHMPSDLQRYFFAACFAEVHKRSPTLEDFPDALLPQHKNATRAKVKEGAAFNDRFRVQTKKNPSTTITSHISKDGHYYIHYDMKQCRALTVREAARLQTFPDNYFFCGSRTEQYHQVGNAVPPLLAVQLAAVVAQILKNKKKPT